MTAHTGAEVALPPPVAALFDGSDLSAKVGQTVSLITVDVDGWPRMSLLSVGEVLTTAGSDIRLALHAHTGSTAALTATGRAMLNLVRDATNYKIRIEVRRTDPADDDGTLAFFAGTVRQVDEDRVPYADLTSGITYRLHDAEGVVARWAHQVDRLRALP